MATRKINSTTHPRGRWFYRLHSLLICIWSFFYVTASRRWRGPLLAGWDWKMEFYTDCLRRQMSIAQNMKSVATARAYLNSMVFPRPGKMDILIKAVATPVKGCWYVPPESPNQGCILYLHGGGYVYHPAVHESLAAKLALAAALRTFALDYRLTPENPFPAQLEDALAAYRWLLESGVNPQQLVVVGDSTGGNLALALLVALRDANQPMPALAVCLSPWTDVSNSGDSLTENQPYDWLQKVAVEQWATWLCNGKEASHPLLSPLNADLHGLPPIFIQAGEAEIFFDMIRSFTEVARRQGVRVTLEIWEHMNHDFQIFGDGISQSQAAIAHLGQVIQQYT